MIRNSKVLRRLCTIALSAAIPALFSTVAHAQADYKLGIVTFLSGGAAGPFGVPAKNASDLLVEAINAGTLPAPYNTKGVAGRKIELVVIDEAGGTAKQVTEFRNLVERQNVDYVIGYISSRRLSGASRRWPRSSRSSPILFDCGTPRIFEDASYKYVFRTGPMAVMDSWAPRVSPGDTPAVQSYAGINQNYAWGQDSWNDFTMAMGAQA